MLTLNLPKQKGGYPHFNRSSQSLTILFFNIAKFNYLNNSQFSCFNITKIVFTEKTRNKPDNMRIACHATRVSGGISKK